jgi:hypothetical protein
MADQAPIEPRHPFRRHLLVKIEVRSNGERNPVAASHILETAQLHDAVSPGEESRANGVAAQTIEAQPLFD